MNKPPDLPFLIWDKTKSLNLSQPGPIYLIMNRTNSEQTLSNVSPFLIKKAIDYTCNGEVEECKKLMSGSLLIKTKNNAQANKLSTLTALSNSISVEVKEYKALNQTKGVIYCNDLRGIPEIEITCELASQNVYKVDKINKFVNGALSETGLTILTFTSSTLPSEIKIGYQIINVRPYIPLPMKCNNCQEFGHTAKYCKNGKICFQCAKDYHLQSEKDVCTNKSNCINCIHNKLENTNHSSKDNICPVFIKQKELQAIKTINKVDNKTAHKIYNERHHHDGALYASVANANANKNAQYKKVSSSRNPEFSQPTTSSRTLIQYDTQSDSELEPPSKSSIPTNTSDTKIKILPRKTSKRLQEKLKSKPKTTTTAKNNQKRQPRSDDDQMDFLPLSDV